MSQDTYTGTEHFTAMTDAWARMTGSFLQGATAANRAALAAFGPETESNGDVATEDTDRRQASIPSLAYEELDWAFERTVERAEDIGVGDSVHFSKVIDDDDVEAFARVSGDTNRLHLDDDFAQETRFKGRIVHGTLASGLISAALARLPGLTIYLSQDLEFRAPVQIGDRVSATVEVIEDLGDGQYRLKTVIEDEDQEQVIIDGEAVVLIDTMPDAE